jgi:indolepyruvate ferredoxin oxidoreductase
MAGGVDRAEPLQRTLPEIVTRRVAFLEEYQDRAYAERYRRRVEQIGALEERLAPASSRLAEAVAHNYFKLLAYKDEYEVARLYTQTDFLASLKRNFGNQFKLKFHFSPPLIAGRDPDSGRPKKYELGGWMLPLLRVLAPLKRLRGTPLDPFGWSRDRRMERELIVEYEELLDSFAAELDARRLDLAVTLAALPQSVRGFGPIKAQAVAKYRAERAAALHEWRSVPVAVARETARASAA